MSDARMKALEAVAEAVAHYRKTRLECRDPEDMRVISARSMMFSASAALQTLDALPAAPPGDVVDRECVLWADKYGTIFWSVPGSDDDSAMQGHRIRLGTVRLALTKEAGDAG